MKRKLLRKNIYYPGGTLSSLTNSNPLKGLKVQGFGNLGNTGSSLLSGVSNTLGSLGAVSGIAQAAMSNAKISDTSDLESYLNDKYSMQVNATDNDSLMEEWSNWSAAKDDYTWKDVRGSSGGQQAMNTLSATGQGALTGAQIGGPIGGIVGGIVGLGSAIAGIFTGKRKAKKKARQLNDLAKKANEYNLLSYDNRINAIDEQNDLNILAGFYDNGGPLTMRYSGPMSPFGNRYSDGGDIHIKKANRGKFTEYCGGKVTSECIAKGKRSSDPAVRKRATFAANARKWKHALGGDLITNGAEWSNGLITVNNGGTHEENPYEGVQMGIDPQGVPNLVEEGEVIFNDYVFSNRLKPTEEMKKKNKYRGETFADVAKYLQRESKERPNDPISKRGLEDSMNKLTILQESIREKDNKNQDSNRYDFGSYLRYEPVLGSVIGLGQNLFSSPDYSGPNSIIEAADQLGRYTPITYTPIGNYLQYKPFDRNYYTNKLNAQAGATRRAIMNTTSPSRNAALLAADYNAQTKLGDLFRQAEEYNLAQRERVEGFNRQTNMAKAEMGLKASMANQEASLKSKSQRLSGLAQAAAMKDTVDSRRSASTSANLTNLFESLGNIGIDSYNRADRDMLIKSGVFGTLSQKPQDWSDKRWNDYKKTVLGTGYSKGGKLKKRKGGLTY